jgi:hypothetical protein
MDARPAATKRRILESLTQVRGFERANDAFGKENAATAGVAACLLKPGNVARGLGAT